MKSKFLINSACFLLVFGTVVVLTDSNSKIFAAPSENDSAADILKKGQEEATQKRFLENFKFQQTCDSLSEKHWRYVPSARGFCHFLNIFIPEETAVAITPNILNGWVILLLIGVIGYVANEIFVFISNIFNKK